MGQRHSGLCAANDSIPIAQNLQKIPDGARTKTDFQEMGSKEKLSGVPVRFEGDAKYKMCSAASAPPTFATFNKNSANMVERERERQRAGLCDLPDG